MSTFAQLPPEEQATRLHRLAVVAAARWPLECVRIEPIKVRENAVYAVHTADERRVVLRVHRLGYHSDEALHSELTWMSALGESGLEVPRPVPSRAGKSFERVAVADVPGPRQVDVFEWIEGWYNPHRRHSALGYRSPVNYERAHQRSVTAIRLPALLPPAA